MTTLTGKQNDFLEAIQDLVELEYDIREVYKEAIAKLIKSDYKIKLNEFCQDHEHYIMELSKLLQNHNEQAPIKPSVIKPLISKGKVALAEIMGDQMILAAMANNEIDTNKAYERINSRHDRWEDATEMLKRMLDDEKKHKKWLDENKQQSNS